MKKLVITTCIIIATLTAWSQKSGDIGFFGGGSYYLGEINHTTQFVDTKPAFGIFYRHFFDYRYSLRTSIYKGTLAGNDSNSPWDYNRLRDHSFSVDIIDVSTMVEFNFLPYITTSPKHRFAPYVTAGLSYMVTPGSNVPNSMAVPFGIGVKFNFAKRFSAGFEYVFRNSFSDDIDGLGDNTPDPLKEEWLNDASAEQFRQKSLIYRNDFYTFAGIFISYKFAYNRFKCPAYGERNMYD